MFSMLVRVEPPANMRSSNRSSSVSSAVDPVAPELETPDGVQVCGVGAAVLHFQAVALAQAIAVEGNDLSGWADCRPCLRRTILVAVVVP